MSPLGERGDGGEGEGGGSLTAGLVTFVAVAREPPVHSSGTLASGTCIMGSQKRACAAVIPLSGGRGIGTEALATGCRGPDACVSTVMQTLAVRITALPCSRRAHSDAHALLLLPMSYMHNGRHGTFEYLRVCETDVSMVANAEAFLVAIPRPSVLGALQHDAFTRVPTHVSQILNCGLRTGVIDHAWHEAVCGMPLRCFKTDPHCHPHWQLRVGGKVVPGRRTRSVHGSGALCV